MSKEAVLAVLERAAEDISFYGQLSEDYAKALQDYDLTGEERAALASRGCALDRSPYRQEAR